MRNNVPVKLPVLTTLIMIALSACATGQFAQPQLSRHDVDFLDKAATPSTNELVYDQALVTMGEYINRNGNFKVNLQPKPIGNTAGGAELPVNLTDMVITALSRVAGDQFNILPFDPQYISSDYTTGGRGSRALPNYIIEGSITEFDKDFETWARTKEMDVLAGGGSSETDVGFANEKSRRVSRIVLDLHLLDYASHAVIPGVTISNSIHVIELDKQKDFGFAIYGSGIGIRGRIKHTQGYHRAVRNLVEYSVLQLLGKFYNMPYWEILGLEGVDPGVTRSIKRSFYRMKPRKKVKALQRLLNQVDLATVINSKSGKPYKYQKLQDDGDYGYKTRDFISAFVRQYRPDISLIDLPKARLGNKHFNQAGMQVVQEIYVALRQQVASTQLASLPEMQIIKDTLIALQSTKEVDKNATQKSASQEQSNITSPKTFFDSVDKSETVIENRIQNN